MIKVVGIDVGFANTGLAYAYVSEGNIDVRHLELVQTEKASSKTIRRSSDDFRRAKEITFALRDIDDNSEIKLAFAEIPSGTQSARASWALGVALGCLASIKKPVIQITPTQTKLASVGTKTATKEEIIQWAMTKYPHLPWIKTRKAVSPKNEHLADAVAIIHAGLGSDEYKWYQSFTPEPK